MKVAILSASPNKKGLTQDCVDISLNVIEKSQCEAKQFKLNDYDLKRCEACGERGWGVCLNEHICKHKDDFNGLYQEISEYDAYIFVTPVYFWEMSEVAKTFFDRLKRCDAFKENSMIKDKKVICIAAAGGSGRGTKETIASFHILNHFIKLKNIAELEITKNNFESKKLEIKDAVQKLIDGEI